MEGTSYMGLGWKPRGIEKSCQAFPKIDAAYSNAEHGAHAEAEGEAEGEGYAEGEAEGEAESTDEVKKVSKREAEAEGEAEAESENEGCVQGTFKFPDGCEKDDCTYIAKWGKKDDDYMWARVYHKAEEDVWTSIGFSENQFMASSHAPRSWADRKYKFCY